MRKNILVIGSGGREHAIAKAFDVSEKVANVYVIPGNPGMLLNTRKTKIINQDWTDFSKLIVFVKKNEIDLTFVGFENALDQGIVDFFKKEGQVIIGPSQEASQLETSKTYAKKVMLEKNIPTARFKNFNPHQYEEAKLYCEEMTLPIVIKEDGLAGGKGVYICQHGEEVLAILSKTLQDKKTNILIEEFLTGPEFSHFSLINEDHIISLGLARDYKRVYDGDRGPNTGGMGAISPVGDDDDILEQQIIDTIVRPLTQQMNAQGAPFTGVLYTGVINTEQGIKVIEFNVRLGDPETQVLLQTIDEDFFDLVWSSVLKRDIQLKRFKKKTIGVVVAAEGYPGAYQKNIPINISGKDLEQTYFAGVTQNQDNELISNGGRVFMVTAQANSYKEARNKVYNQLEKYRTKGLFFRTDIGIECEK